MCGLAWAQYNHMSDKKKRREPFYLWAEGDVTRGERLDKCKSTVFEDEIS